MNTLTIAEDILENVEDLVGKEEPVETVEPEFQGWAHFGESFKYMGLGMLGIFMVTCVLILSITLLNKIKNKN